MGKKQKKRIVKANFMAKNAGIFRCPICSTSMRIVEAKSLICANRHCFDIARQGYVNFLSRPHRTKYNKQLFTSRSIISAGGFFKPLVKQISSVIINSQLQNEQVKILDAGCGEGSLLSSLLAKLNKNSNSNFLGVGLDIAKEGIAMAAREYPQSIWCVADLAKCPLASKQFNFIINILSPSNYAEFQRLITDEGIIIKVVPGSKYLQELREVFYSQTDKQVYSSKEIIQIFSDNLILQDKQQVKYSVNLDQALLAPLVYMTPLSWSVTEEQLQNVLKLNFNKITFDFTILLGKK